MFALSPGLHKPSDFFLKKRHHCCSATVGETGCLALNRPEAVKAHSVLTPKESGHNTTKLLGKVLLSFLHQNPVKIFLFK